jgi:hypothetical protein
MDSILNQIVNAENVRTLMLLVFGFGCFVWLKTSIEKKLGSIDKRIDGLDHKIDMVEASLNKKIDDLRAELKGEIKELKYNDFAHLSSAFEALTFTLEKNGSMSKEDKDYIIGRLAPLNV